jgi:hypothetical protein
MLVEPHTPTSHGTCLSPAVFLCLRTSLLHMAFAGGLGLSLYSGELTGVVTVFLRFLPSLVVCLAAGVGSEGRAGWRLFVFLGPQRCGGAGMSSTAGSSMTTGMGCCSFAQAS